MDNLKNAIVDAIAAFDAANHAFGRFVTYGVRPRGAIPGEVQAVRAALQEATLAVPHGQTRAAAIEFLVAMRSARDRLGDFLARPPPDYDLTEALAAPAALGEAIEALERGLPLPPTPRRIRSEPPEGGGASRNHG